MRSNSHNHRRRSTTPLNGYEGTNERELTEAVAMAGMVRHWSTILNGRQADKVAFKKDISRLVAGAKKHMAMQKHEATTAAR